MRVPCNGHPAPVRAILIQLVEREGLEPSTPALWDRRNARPSRSQESPVADLANQRNHQWKLAQRFRAEPGV